METYLFPSQINWTDTLSNSLHAAIVFPPVIYFDAEIAATIEVGRVCNLSFLVFLETESTPAF